MTTMKNLDCNRQAAVRDIRKTLDELNKSSTRMGILRHCEILHSQVFYLSQMVSRTITRNQVLYPEHDWEWYRDAVAQETLDKEMTA